MERYEEWDVSIPPLPPRSRLYRLKPIGIGTPYVESLTSYIMRLAESHCVTPQALVQREIFPLWNQTGTIQNYSSWFSKFWWTGSPVLNGVSPITAQWVQVLQTLTSNDNLHFLTMLTWSELIGVNNLLRRKKAWCPRCFQEWRQNRQIVYEPLLWTLSAVNICPCHQQTFVTLCQHCQETQPFLTRVARPGYCLHCMRWLGNNLVSSSTETMSSITDTFKMHQWQASVTSELLAAAPKLLGPPSNEQFAITLNNYLKDYARGHINVLARLLKLPYQRLQRYLQRGHVPTFDSLLQLCYSLSVTPLEFTVAGTISSQETRQFVLDLLPVLSSGKRKHLTDDDVQRMRQTLEFVLEVEEGDPIPNLQQIAQRIGYHVNTLRNRCPDLCHAIVMRRMRIGDDARNQMRQALVDALANDEPLSLKAVAEGVGCSCASLYKYFPDLASSVVTRYLERFDRERIRQRLQEVLSGNERTPSIRELARQLGCKHYFLERNFHGLYKQIVLRRRRERRKQYQDRMERTYAEIREAIMELHQQGIYPSRRRVVKEINKPYALRSKEGLEVYGRVLKELGYPTETIKKVGFGKN